MLDGRGASAGATGISEPAGGVSATTNVLLPFHPRPTALPAPAYCPSYLARVSRRPSSDSAVTAASSSTASAPPKNAWRGVSFRPPKTRHPFPCLDVSKRLLLSAWHKHGSTATSAARPSSRRR